MSRSQTLAQELEVYPKLPQSPAERTCLLCGCVESRACPGGCAWEDVANGSNWGVCSVCIDDKLCPIAQTLMLSALAGERWKRKAGCACPVCKAARPTKARKEARR